MVEDDPDDFVLLRRALKRNEAELKVLWAHDSSEALKALGELIASARRLCLVSDLKLPGMDGFELLHLVKQWSEASRIRFVFLTGRADPSTKARALQAGADGFFVKPACSSDWQEIARALERVLLEERGSAEGQIEVS